MGRDVSPASAVAKLRLRAGRKAGVDNQYFINVQEEVHELDKINPALRYNANEQTIPMGLLSECILFKLKFMETLKYVNF